jgi:benzoyl-CoA reductase subunit B
MITARGEEKLVITGGADTPQALVAGLGDHVYLAGEPYGATIATDPEFSERCVEAVEARGFARDMCGYMRNYWGSMYVGRYFFGGGFPRLDFCLQLHICDTQAKWWQVVSEHLGVPFFGIDFPVWLRGQRLEARQEYLVAQMHDCIEWMEGVSGRRYDDEKLIQAVRNSLLTSSLWGEIMLLNRAVPAPLDQKSIFALYIISVLMRYRPEAVEFYRMLRDEVRERVESRIAAVATERCRLLDDGQPPWYFLRFYRFLEQYGAVVVGSHYSLFLAGDVSVTEDGKWTVSPTPEQEGRHLDSRDDALQSLARWSLERDHFEMYSLPLRKGATHVSMAREWHVDGAILHLNRGCEGISCGNPESRLALLEAGIPVMVLDFNMGDEREFDEAQVKDMLESFVESLGLRKLEVP